MSPGSFEFPWPKRGRGGEEGKGVTRNRNVCLSIAGHPVLGKPGVYEQPMFVKGGYQQPPLPLNIICKDAPTAMRLYSVLLPVVERIYKLNPEKFDIKKFVNSNEFQEVACELDGDDCLKWAVKLGKYVGVFLSGYVSQLGGTG
ncbi:MAG: hypothetical protein NXY57DRAFT_1044393 [Lentinula lateritia]|uniref:Uncharacterized protein n=1 Tax=Lentinula lateritia TaxID=40482 RepID=A0ABQ8VGN4_9AGAR|nr:MAG: hypothetical protein NXY57DRAFT_1044393 [Lentinula lateritia]KAJ4492276.1 hypothetical protein C8R41DRAFT_867344 [Lentinula lateritia]